MTVQEKLLHAIAFDVARRVEEVLAIPRRQRARMFFDLFQAVKRGLEEFSLRSGERSNRLVPDRNGTITEGSFLEKGKQHG